MGMRNTVVWPPKLLNELGRIWNRYRDPRITVASNEADRRLATSPEKGKRFFGDLLLEVPPLYVVYKYSPDDRLVLVKHIWYH
jgi:hypothetical protein